jgi:hypothetical protein
VTKLPRQNRRVEAIPVGAELTQKKPRHRDIRRFIISVPIGKAVPVRLQKETEQPR